MAKELRTIPQLPETGYLRLTQILQFVPIGRSTWWQGVREGRFPQPIKLSPRVTVWKAEDIRNFLGAPVRFEENAR